ncbi:MAG: hypothetical protein U0I22_08745 [Treponema sp.]|nr:hypothetical protein [Treponema sp.]
MRLSGKNIFTTVLSLICLCFITSCSFVGDVVHSLLIILSTDIWEGETVSWEYNGTEVQYELPNGVRTLTLDVNDSVDIYMAKMNVGSTVIPASSTRYIVSTSTGEEQNIGGFLSSRSAEEENLLLEIDDWENVSGITPSGFIRKDFIPARDFKPPFFAGVGSGRSAMAASVASEPMKSVTSGAVELGVGEKKELWVDVPASTAGAIKLFVNSSKYTKRRATLQAVGTNCYIWVLDDNFSDSTASGDKITQTEAKNLATQFDSMYLKIREVFGTESNEIISTNGFYTISDTKVNIVVYDIEDDYTPKQNSGTAGYFWPKDYYTATEKPSNKNDVLPLSNNGKYFYVDSGFLNDYPDMIYSTLAHEFQHMIHFGQKYVNNGRNSSTWFNEMMSMVCEDMIQEYLGIELLDSPVYRLLTFATNYYRSGLTDWLQDSNVDYSYAGAYAFGAYLARNYGGKDLIKQIATNQYVDQDAITQALKAIGKNESFETVFKKYPQALLLDNAPAGVPSFNKSVQGIGGGMMPKINLFESLIVNGQPCSIRPGLMYTDADKRVALRPYGFTLHSIGATASAGTVNITFSSPVSTNEKIYILVQPCNHNHQ